DQSFCDSAGWITQREPERASRNGAQFAAFALAPGFCRQHQVTGICRNRFPRSSPHLELRAIQFLDSSLEASLDSNRAAVGIDDNRRSDVVAADDQPAGHGKSA